MIDSGPTTIARVTRAALVLVLAIASCGRARENSRAQPKVAVSIFPIYDLTRRIAGDRLDVRLVLPPGRSEHGYDPTPQELAALDGTKLGITVGFEMDAWVEAMMRSAGTSTVFRIAEQLPTIPIDVEPIGEPGAHERAHETAARDPHVWLDPQRMVVAVELIAAQLAAIDPAGKAVFVANAETLQQSLRALDAAIAARAKAWTKRTIVTFHGSMAYYARRYGVRIAAVIEPLAGKEPTAAYIAEVLAAIERSGAVALFSEPQLDPGPAQMIAREAGIRVGELDPVGGLAGRESYEALLTWNTDQLEAVLR